MDALLSHIERFASLDSNSIEQLRASVRRKEVRARSFLFEAGEIPKDLHFVETGIFRLFDIDEQAKERTLQFALPGWWITDFDGFLASAPSTFSLQAVEASSVFSLSLTAYEPLLERVPSLERYFRRVYQRAASAALRRIHLMASKSGEQLYADFRRAYPDFVERVPQSMLASFLGFTPEHLSRIRQKLARS